jgi:hypothetical protein
MPEKGNYKGHRYYGELVDIKDVVETYYEIGEVMLCTNRLLGRDAVEFLEELLPVINSCKLDNDDGKIDTLFIEVKEDCYKEFMRIITRVRPDEIDEGDENVWRVWWD